MAITLQKIRLDICIFNSYSSSPNGLCVACPYMRPRAKWPADSEAMRARGIIVLVKSNWLVKNIETKQLKARL